MIWTYNFSRSEIMSMEPGKNIMGDIDYLGWAVVKSFVHDDDQKIEFSKENNLLNKYFLKKRNTWKDITRKFSIQFKILIRQDGYEVYFKEYSGKRYMKYDYTTYENVDMKNIIFS